MKIAAIKTFALPGGVFDEEAGKGRWFWREDGSYTNW